jgi:hypothetical protein
MILTAALVTPFAASALSIEELQTQIRELLQKVQVLQAELRQSTSAAVAPERGQSDIVATSLPRICNVTPFRAFSVGERGTDVQSLQEFLKSEGLLDADATGYYGPLTRSALGSWQMRAGVVAEANPAIGWGQLGPRTRAAIAEWCKDPGARGSLRAGPQKGAAPLTVTFSANVQIANPQFIADAGDYKIVFGDGTEHVFPCTAVDGFCRGPHTVTHTYRENGTYEAELIHYGYFGMPGPDGGPPTNVAGRVTIQVGERPVACTMQYEPVCAEKRVVCITTPCNPVQQTYGNRCVANADGAKVVHEGVCRADAKDPANDRTCRTWYDGCNTCSRSEPGGPAICTLRACSPESMGAAYCSAHFDDTRNGTPVISRFSGPTSLAVNETGTWGISASDPENGRLTYSIVWGDEWYRSNAAHSLARPEGTIVQQSTFTHSYARAGTYTVQVSVADEAGNTVRSSSTVTVTQNTCTAEYAPVCGRPSGCANTCPPGMACPAICQLHQPQTYSNRCQLNNANADFIHEGVCTGQETY